MGAKLNPFTMKLDLVNDAGIATETDPLSLHLDQTTGQALTNVTDVTVTASDEIYYGDVTDTNKIKKDTVQGILDLVPAPDLSAYAKLTDTAQNITANSFVTDGGTSSQFVKGDGSLDSSTYLTSVEGTAVKSTGEAGGTKFLREDGDGTSSWQAVPSPDLTPYAKLDGTNQPFTGNLNVSKSAPEIKITDTGNSGYARLNLSTTNNALTVKNVVAVPATATTAVDLDGSTEYFTNANAISTFIQNGDYTVAVWVYPSGAGPTANPEHGEGIIGDSYNQGYWNLKRSIYGGNDKIWLSWYTGGYGANALGLAYTANAWNLIIVERSSGTVTLYNMTLGTSASDSTDIAISNLNQPLEVGRGYNSDTWTGKIDDLAIWKRALASGERDDIYNSGNGLYLIPANTFPSSGTPISTNMTALWRFDDGGSSANAADSSGNGRTLTGVGIGAPDWVAGKINLPTVDTEVTVLTSQDGTGASEQGIHTLGNIAGRTVLEGLTTRFNVAGTEQMQMNDGALVPTTTNDIDLGTTALLFKNGYFNGTMSVGVGAPIAKAHISVDGTTVASHLYSAGDALDLTSNGSTVARILGASDTAATCPTLFFTKSKGTLASPAIVANGDTLAEIKVQAADSASARRDAAKISFAVDGTPGALDMPGRIGFWTTPDGSSTIAERVRIDNAGHLKIIADSKRLYWGAADDAYAEFDSNSLNIVANAVTASDSFEVTAGGVTFNVGASGTVYFSGTNSNVTINTGQTATGELKAGTSIATGGTNENLTFLPDLGGSTTASINWCYYNGSAWKSIIEYANTTGAADGLLILAKTTGRVGIGTTAPTAKLHLAAGTATASTAPLKFTSGTLLSATEAGAVEFLTNDYYATRTTGAGGNLSYYPPAQSSTYVKATTEQSANLYAYFATDPTKSLTGSFSGTSWATTNPGTTTNQALHIDLGSAKSINRIYYQNWHNSGANTDRGVKNFTLWGSNTAGAFADTTYATDTDWTQITAGLSATNFDQHTASDVADPKYITLTSTTAYRYYRLKFADNWGGTAYMGLRRVELQDTTQSNGRGKIVITNAESGLTTGRIPYATTGGFLIDSANLTYDGTLLTLGEANNLVLGTTTGTKIGTATSQKLGFYNATPVDQPATVADPSGGATVDAEARTAINSIIDRLQELGLVA
jgi:hypothetical protein